MKKSQKKTTFAQEEIRKVDVYFQELDNTFKGNKVVYAVFLTLAFFGVLGLIWMIPFPQLDFLKRMNAHTYLNWASFYIAIVVYIYLKIAPTLSYAILFTIGIMSFFIVQLEYLEKDGGPSVVLVTAILALVGLAGLGLYSRREPTFSSSSFNRLLWIGPIWLWSKVFRFLKIKY
ncbi:MULTISPECIES: hypothetical protein [Sphingobacterium]|uniref:DUF962 domain-containing protein n=1 Tax=Sphingobacterium thermophilum TaxID=768534 RepID=A0ABP8QXR9_9SPHI|nr:hypothetical protein [Sphingobacterium sp. T2]